MVMQARSRGSFLRLHTDPTPCLNKPSQGCSTQGALAALLRCMFWCSTGQRRLRHLQHHSVLVSAVNSKKGYLVHSHAGCPQKYIVYVLHGAVQCCLHFRLHATNFGRLPTTATYLSWFTASGQRTIRRSASQEKAGVGKGM